ncbi:MAG TPA: glycoside hydrolase family 3 N-terminal domain-containing protein [Candidatus Kryptonia bacterium]|nr:glycoside hydrolase family 3 N-terminal domain-containing protein [Candidatus Kryptonia bacterium]
MATGNALYRDRTQAIDTRVRDLLARMTLAEKLAQLGGVWSTSLLDDGSFSPDKAREKLLHGTGHLTRIGGATVLAPAESAALVNTIQKFLIEQTRLGIPAIVHEESCAGYTARGATCFPQAIGLAATWEPELIEAMTAVIRTQMRAVGAHQSLAPVLDVARDPRWGRTEETFGEDPYLISRMGVAYIRGLQGRNLSRGIVATAKHFVGYGASEGGMNWAPAHIPPRELREIYIAPFAAAIKEAQLASVMNAYSEIDGVPLGSSKALLVELLRGEIGFDGVVVSDYFTLPTLLSYHRIADDEATVARFALEAGIDVELPALHCYGEPLRQAVETGRIDPALIEAGVARVLKMKFQLGLFEHPYVDAGTAAEVFDTAEQRALARRLAQKSLVLLKNDGGLLPLKPTLNSVAVIGPSADSIRLLQGDYHYPAHLEMMFGEIKEGDLSPRPQGGVDLAQHFVRMVSVLEAIKAKVAPHTVVHFAAGCGILDESTQGFAAAIAAAAESEIAIVVGGEKSGLADGCTSGESIDRADLGLAGVQQALVEAVVATGTPVVVVLISGRPLAVPWIAEHVPAVLAAWVPGEEGGSAVADVLFGDVNPGGKLPLSLPRSVGQVPAYYNHKPSGGRSNWKGDYVGMSSRPLFPFGHGLSFTTFEYRNLTIDPSRVRAGESVRIEIEVKNVGARTGDEVVQLYVHDVVASVTRPIKALKGFKRVTLAPGANKRVTFDLAVNQLAFYDRDMKLVVEPGTIEVMIGSSSDDIRLTGQFEIVGEATLVRAWETAPTTIRVD